MTPILNEKTLQLILSDRKLRSSITRESAIYFATIYFPHYFGYGFAQFQYDMFGIVEDRQIEFAIAITFRGSGKSTLFTTIAPLWYVMGILQRKHVLIVCQTQEQARSHMASIKAELEANELLRDDLGPFKETNTTWNSMSLEFSKYGAKITAVSIDQSIRGLRYKQYRPDVIICDDIEDSSSVKTKEGRKRIHELYSSEIAPLGDLNTKIIMVGNYLHPNSLLTTLREALKSGNFGGRGKELFIPLVNDEQQIAWPQKFQSMSDIEKLKELVADHRVWMQEYMLKVVPEEDQLVTYEDVRWYDEIPQGWEPYFRFRAAGVDLAITKNLHSDLTAIVSAEVYRNGKDYHIFIQRNPINKRFNFRETIEFLHGFKGAFPGTHLFVESVGYQESLIEQLREEGINAHEAKIGNLSKQERLAIVVHWIRKGMIHFPTDGATDLVNQIVNFGAELHDDLVDAFTLLIMQIMKYANDDAIPTETDDYSGPMIIPGGFMNWAIRTHSQRKKFNPRTLEGDLHDFKKRGYLYD